MGYNENDPHVAAWLRELMADGQIPEGHIDERSIEELQPGDCPSTFHAFAGVGGWAYALELAGWDATRPIWTGSAPCQPFSTAGRRKGADDARHLWPAWFRLIRECRPATLFGEQVASGDGRAWFAAVRADLEQLGYAVGCADLCAAGIGAPHIRQRLFWVADRQSGGLGIDGGASGGAGHADKCGSARGLADTERGAAERPRLMLAEATRGLPETAREQRFRADTGDGCATRGLADTDGRTGVEGEPQSGQWARTEGIVSPWSDVAWLPCSDGGHRPIESGLEPLAHGLPRRVVPSGDPSASEANSTGEARRMRLRGYGNAIVPQLAAVFVRAFLEGEHDPR